MADRRDNRLESNKQKLRDAEERKRRLELRKATLLSDRKKLLQLPEFQRVMSDILGRGGVLHSCMSGNSYTFHNSGRQDFSREILNDMTKADPDAGFELLRAVQFGEDDV